MWVGFQTVLTDAGEGDQAGHPSEDNEVRADATTLEMSVINSFQVTSHPISSSSSFN